MRDSTKMIASMVMELFNGLMGGNTQGYGKMENSMVEESMSLQTERKGVGSGKWGKDSNGLMKIKNRRKIIDCFILFD